MAVTSVERSEILRQPAQEGYLGRSLLSFIGDLKRKAIEVATTNSWSATLLYRIGVTSNGYLMIDCGFQIGNPNRVVGKLQ